MENTNGVKEIAVVDAPSNLNDLAVSRAPEEVLTEAHRAAVALKDVITKKAKPVRFNGEQYLEFEDWQTVGHFYGTTVETKDAERVEINGVEGARARATLIDVRSGKVVGGAEAYCMRDEANWKNKPWFQLASMAQTRAGSKTYRNAFSWVVVLAGYRPTPAEEMTETTIMSTTAALPTKPKETPKTASAPLPGLGTIRFIPTEVKVHEGKAKSTGKPYTAYGVVHPEGHVFKTFDAKYADIAKRCVNKDELEISYVQSKYGMDIQTIEQVSADPLGDVLHADAIENPY